MGVSVINSFLAILKDWSRVYTASPLPVSAVISFCCIPGTIFCLFFGSFSFLLCFCFRVLFFLLLVSSLVSFVPTHTHTHTHTITQRVGDRLTARQKMTIDEILYGITEFKGSPIVPVSSILISQKQLISFSFPGSHWNFDS